MSFISKYFTYAGTNVRYSLEMNYSPLRQSYTVQVLLLVLVRYELVILNRNECVGLIYTKCVL